MESSEWWWGREGILFTTDSRENIGREWWTGLEKVVGRDGFWLALMNEKNTEWQWAA